MVSFIRALPEISKEGSESTILLNLLLQVKTGHGDSYTMKHSFLKKTPKGKRNFLKVVRVKKE